MPWTRGNQNSFYKILHLTLVTKWGYPTLDVKLVLVSTPIPWGLPLPLTKALPTQITVGTITWVLMGMD